MALKTHRLARFRDRAGARAGPGRRLQRADRRNRRGQIHPRRCTATGAGRPGGRRRGARRRRPRGHQRRIRPAGRAHALAGRGRFRSRRQPAAAPQHRQPGQEPGVDQRQPGHGHAVARTGRPAGGHPRPARLAEPDPARSRARPAGRLRGLEHPGTAAAVAALAGRPEDTGGRARGAGLAAARTRAPRMADCRSGQAGARRTDEWDELNTNHARLANAQSLLEAAQGALQALEGEDGGAASSLSQAQALLQGQEHVEPAFRELAQVLASSLAQAEDAAHSLHGYLRKTDLDPQRLAELDERMSLWMSLSRRYRRTPAELPALAGSWKEELAKLDAAADLAALEAAEKKDARRLHGRSPRVVQGARQGCAAAGQGRHAGHAGPGHAGRPLRGGAADHGAADARRPGRDQLPGGGPRRQHAAAGGQGCIRRRTVAHRAGHRRDDQPPGHRADADLRRGRFRRRRGRRRNRGPADEAAGARPPGAGRHAPAAGGRLRRSSSGRGQARATPPGPSSTVSAVQGEQRVAEVARMLGGEHLSGTTLAHAKEMLSGAAARAPVKS